MTAVPVPPAARLANYRAPALAGPRAEDIETQLAIAWARLSTQRSAIQAMRRVTVLPAFEF
jgi:hypothetical protein